MLVVRINTGFHRGGNKNREFLEMLTGFHRGCKNVEILNGWSSTPHPPLLGYVSDILVHFYPAYESYCEDLKSKLRLLEQENKRLREGVLNDGENSPALALLSAMTGLSVTCTFNSHSIQRYSCSVLDGVLEGTLCVWMGYCSLVSNQNSIKVSCQGGFVFTCLNIDTSLTSFSHYTHHVYLRPQAVCPRAPCAYSYLFSPYPPIASSPNSLRYVSHNTNFCSQ